MWNFKKTALVFLIVIVVSFIGFEVLKSESNYRLLAKEGNLSIAVIVREKEKVKRHKVLYYYSFKVDSQSFTHKIQFDYHWKDIKLNIGDSIYVLYLPTNPRVSCDYRYLKENDYGIDTIKYEQQMRKFGFYERTLLSNKKSNKINF